MGSEMCIRDSLFLVLLTIQLLMQDTNQFRTPLTIFLKVFNLLFIIFELLNLIGSPIDYFSRIWNLSNIIGNVLLGVSLYDNGSNINILTFAIFFVYMKGISFLRNFDNTRILIRLVTEVIKDLKSFTILLLSVIFVSSMVTYTLAVS